MAHYRNFDGTNSINSDDNKFCKFKNSLLQISSFVSFSNNIDNHLVCVCLCSIGSNVV